MTYRTTARIGLGYLAAFAGLIGIWATLAPRSFYDDFPSLGRTWISPDGPYNEHLVRDVGGLYLAVGVLFVAAAVTLARSMVVTAAVAGLATGVPHFLYHATNTDTLGTVDNIMSLSGLGTAVAFPVLLLWVAPRLAD